MKCVESEVLDAPGDPVESSDGVKDELALYLVTVLAAQVLGGVPALIDLPVGTTFTLMVASFLIETAGPAYAEKRGGGPPWHAHHIADRYGVMIIIALGEGMIGTMASINVLAGEGLTWDAGLLALSGTALTFGIWWWYFVVPAGNHPSRATRALIQLRLRPCAGFGSIGACLHVAAYYVGHEAHNGRVAMVLIVAVRVAVFIVVFYAGYSAVTQRFDAFHMLLLVLTGAMIVASMLMASAQVDLTWCLLVLSLFAASSGTTGCGEGSRPAGLHGGW